ncbi:hypothetical protein MARLIPOL_03155 [Marinobacter lipolyticus SM19]|uniref:Uncharacterized protein n=1 Tax=Marinobacter lipolyticus SM19 TaxID=1318628 RepID=R8B4X9_9GAMM|nr:hypothetical protein [Marinobacter lipolyticus]EON93670.1 hypothetical protein MARLIPOL_03155 [Marinobacter lipolyticus SM19]
MKHTFIYSASLSLLLAVSPSYGDQWERQLNYEGAAQSLSGTASTVRYDWSEVTANRRMQLERGTYQETAFDINNLPPTAAGPQESSDMDVDWLEVEINRRKQLERGTY